MPLLKSIIKELLNQKKMHTAFPIINLDFILEKLNIDTKDTETARAIKKLKETYYKNYIEFPYQFNSGMPQIFPEIYNGNEKIKCKTIENIKITEIYDSLNVSADWSNRIIKKNTIIFVPKNKVKNLIDENKIVKI